MLSRSFRIAETQSKMRLKAQFVFLISPDTPTHSSVPTNTTQGVVKFGEWGGHAYRLRRPIQRLPHHQAVSCNPIPELLSLWTFSIVRYKTEAKILKWLCIESGFCFRLQVNNKNKGGGGRLRGNKPNQLGPFEWANLKHCTMEKVHKLNNSEYKPSSESVSIYL
jgi:hypothetical protein